ncbi:MAG: 30S ribosomal protein S4 [Candidatus Sungbacteria bacterium]|nr:30S ribosomal protein S4 [Candidatus Sungbacteria bacterium]
MPLSRPKEKIERRIGERLFLKGERSFSQKAGVARRPYPPGQHGKRKTGRGGFSEFGQQLKEKQKVRHIYGISDRALKKYFTLARRNRAKPTDETLAELLERRLDNVVFRLGLALSRSIGRHMVSYGHITVNGKRAKQPSLTVKPSDIISIAEKSRNLGFFQDLGERMKKYSPPAWLEFDPEKYEGKLRHTPALQDISGQQNMSLVVEYYSR